MNQCIIIIVRIEFFPLVEIGVNKGHYYPEETTDEGPTQVDAETGTFFKLTNKQVSHNRSGTGHVLFMFYMIKQARNKDKETGQLWSVVALQISHLLTLPRV